MSIFINSKVHLPISCEKCPFNYADLSAGICIAADKTIDTRTYNRRRHPDCPMTELPTPHGRLIDADELTKHMRSYYPSIDHLCRSQHVVTKGDIDNAPTIIEAEVSE